MKKLIDIAKEILSEITIVNPNKKFLFGVDKEGIWNELIKLERYENSDDALNDINDFFGYVGDECYYNEGDLMKNPKYVYLSDDGQALFTIDFSNFSEYGDNLDKWNIDKWITPKEFLNTNN